MEQKFYRKGTTVSQSRWKRIERRDQHGKVQDWVEVAACKRCGKGVDRAFPVEYRLADGQILCRDCVPQSAAYGSAIR